MIRQRRVAEPTLPIPAPRTAKGPRAAAKMDVDLEPESRRQVPSPDDDDERRPLLPQDANQAEDRSHSEDDNDNDKMGWVRQNKWIVLAIASGACAAFNGVFAKLYVEGP